MKISKVLSSIWILSVVVSCDNGNGPCGGLSGYPKSFNITDFDLNSLVESDDNTFDYLYGEPYVESDVIEYSELILSLESIVELTTLHRQREHFFKFSLIENAVACSPAPPRAEEKIVRFDITSSYDYSAEFPAGTNLNANFDVVYSDAWTPYERYTNGSISFYTLAEYMDQDNIDASRTFQLKLNQAPQYLGSQKFYISIELDSGDQFEIETSEFNFGEP